MFFLLVTLMICLLQCKRPRTLSGLGWQQGPCVGTNSGKPSFPPFLSLNAKRNHRKGAFICSPRVLSEGIMSVPVEICLFPRMKTSIELCFRTMVSNETNLSNYYTYFVHSVLLSWHSLVCSWRKIELAGCEFWRWKTQVQYKMITTTYAFIYQYLKCQKSQI